MRLIVMALLAALTFSFSSFAQSSVQSAGLQVGSSPAGEGAAHAQAVDQNLKDVHFAFDQFDLDDQARQARKSNAEWLNANPDVRISIAGDADERGEIVYNLALSDKRAQVTRDALVELGVAPERIVFSTGWGKLYPVCDQSDENCWGQNRRAHFSAGSDLQTQVARDNNSPSGTSTPSGGSF